MNCSSVSRISLVQALCESLFLSIQRWHRWLWWYYPCIQAQLKRRMRDQHSCLKPHALKLCPLFAGTICCLTTLYSDSSFLCSLHDRLALNKSPCSFFCSWSVSYFCPREAQGSNVLGLQVTLISIILWVIPTVYLKLNTVWNWIHTWYLQVKDAGHSGLQNHSSSQ